jgi:hypothetical protein
MAWRKAQANALGQLRNGKSTIFLLRSNCIATSENGMSFCTFAAFWSVSFLFVITLGADWAYAITAGMHGGWCFPL